MRPFIPLSLSNTGYMDRGNSGRWTCFAGCKPLTDVWSIIIQLILVSIHLNSKIATIKVSFVILLLDCLRQMTGRLLVACVYLCVCLSVCACAWAFIRAHTTIHAHVEARGQHQGLSSSFLLNLIYTGTGKWTQDLVHLKQEHCRWAILISPDLFCEMESLTKLKGHRFSSATSQAVTGLSCLCQELGF